MINKIHFGKRISLLRRKEGLSQADLAQMLGVTSQAVSKWECGKGLPEVSLLLPLCGLLEISVNDLLSGEKVCEIDYRKKAEENMMDLIKENQENRRRMGLSIVCGSITIVAVCSLVLLASYLILPTIARIALIFLAVATAIAGITAAAMLEIRAGYYQCPNCKALFVPTMAEYVKGYHTLTRRRLTCPECGKTGMCKHRITR